MPPPSMVPKLTTETTATIALGHNPSAKLLEIVGTVLADILVVVWLMVIYDTSDTVAATRTGRR